MDRVGTRQQVVRVLDEDPDLARAIPEAQRDEALRRSLARVLPLEATRWYPHTITAEADWMGLLLLDGVLIRRVAVGHHAACELLGAGDLLRPWEEDSYEPLRVSIEWLVVAPARAAILDSAFMRRTACWPTISAQLARRIAQRARALSVTALVTHLPRVHTRLLMLFWLLSQRWGRVTPAGIVTTLPLTHDTLAMIVGCRRPSATLGIQKLTRDGLLLRQARHRWLLTHAAMDAIAQPL